MWLTGQHHLFTRNLGRCPAYQKSNKRQTDTNKINNHDKVTALWGLPSNEDGQSRYAAAAAAESLQSYLTLCDPIDGSPPGSSVPGMVQARTLEWVAISFSNA